MKSLKLLSIAMALMFSISGCDLLSLFNDPDGPGVTSQLPSVLLGEEFDLGFGQAVQIPSASIAYVKFTDVLEDSRCPLDVTCVWAGNAKVQVEVRELGKAANKIELNTTNDPREVFFGTFRVDLVNVMPKKTSTRELSEQEYIVTLKVEDVQEPSGF